jgi:hypothetical protein
MIQTWNNECTIVKQRWYDGENTMSRWWKYDGTMMKLRWHDDENAILFSPLCHCISVISSLCYRCFIIVPSCFYHRTIVSSRFHHCTIVHSGSGRQNVLLMSKRITEIGRYLNETISRLVSNLAGISRLVLHLVRRRETRKSFEAIYR